MLGERPEWEVVVRLLLSLIVCATFGLVVAQGAMVKTGPGGGSVVEVVCEDAFRSVDRATRLDLERRFRSTIVVRCLASASRGSGRVAYSDFTYRNRYASDERLHSFRMTDVSGQMGEVYGSVVRDFFIGLPSRQRPWVIVLYFGAGSTQIVFTSDR
jgi:hypothetical protein